MENCGKGCKMANSDCRTRYGLYQDVISLPLSFNQEKWDKAVFWVFDVPNSVNKCFEVSFFD